jgi:hypothetical protein
VLFECENGTSLLAYFQDNTMRNLFESENQSYFWEQLEKPKLIFRNDLFLIYSDQEQRENPTFSSIHVMNISSQKIIDSIKMNEMTQESLFHYKLMITSNQVAVYGSSFIHSFLPLPLTTHFTTPFFEENDLLVDYLNIPSKNRSVICSSRKETMYYYGYNDQGIYTTHLITLKKLPKLTLPYSSSLKLFLSSDESYFILMLREAQSIMIYVYYTNETIPTSLTPISIPCSEEMGFNQMDIKEVDGKYLALSIKVGISTNLYLINTLNDFFVDYSFPNASKIFPTRYSPHSYFILFEIPLINENRVMEYSYYLNYWNFKSNFLLHSYELGSSSSVTAKLSSSKEILYTFKIQDNKSGNITKWKLG